MVEAGLGKVCRRTDNCPSNGPDWVTILVRFFSICRISWLIISIFWWQRKLYLECIKECVTGQKLSFCTLRSYLYQWCVQVFEVFVAVSDESTHVWLCVWRGYGSHSSEIICRFAQINSYERKQRLFSCEIYCLLVGFVCFRFFHSHIVLFRFFWPAAVGTYL